LSARRKELARFFSDPDEATTREAVVEYLEDLMLIHGLGEASVVSDDGKTLLEVQRIDSPEATVADDSGDALFERSDIGSDVSAASWFRKATQVVERTSWDVYLADAESSAESIPVISGAVAVPIAGGESPAGFVTFVLPLS